MSLFEDVDSIFARDPAARSRLEIIVCYPSFHAVSVYRLSHWLWQRGMRLLPRWLSQMARWLTGVEIHPGAVIGKRFFIDHAMGVVIGETVEIGDDVTLYHGVTLGGIAPSIESEKQRLKKRHPTLEDNVIVGCGAQILGPVTIGRCARVGANSVVVKDIPPMVTVVGVPARAVARAYGSRDIDFKAYGTPQESMADPYISSLQGLSEEVARLQRKIAEMERVAKGEAEEKSESVLKQTPPPSCC